MPTFDVVSEVDYQEVRNAVDQVQREISTRYDFKDTDSSIELEDKQLVLRSNSDQRLKALIQVLEERWVKRELSVKALQYEKVEQAASNTVRQNVKIAVGINADKAREIGKFIKGLPLKGVQHQVQGDQLRITGKKRDDLQNVIAALKEEDFAVPLQFTNFRD